MTTTQQFAIFLGTKVDLDILNRPYRNRTLSLYERLQIGLGLNDGTLKIGDVVKNLHVSRSYAYELRNWAPQYKKALDYLRKQQNMESMQQAMDEMETSVGFHTMLLEESRDPPSFSVDTGNVTIAGIGDGDLTTKAPAPLTEETTLSASLPSGVPAPGDESMLLRSVVPQPGLPTMSADFVSLTDIAEQLKASISPLSDTFIPLAEAIDTVGSLAEQLSGLTMQEPHVSAGALETLPSAIEKLTGALHTVVVCLDTLAAPDSLAPLGDAIEPLGDIIALLSESTTILADVVVSLVETVEVIVESPELLSGSSHTEPITPVEGQPLWDTLGLVTMGDDLVNYGRLAPRTNTTPLLVIDQECIRKTVISLAIECIVSEKNIRRHIAEIYHVNIAESDIWRIVNRYEEVAKQVNLKYDKLVFPAIRTMTCDEIYFSDKPTLVCVDPESLYTILFVSEDDRKEETWILHFWDLRELGLRLIAALCDDCGPLTAAIAEAFGIEPQNDVFHVKKNVGNEVAQIEKKAIAILRDQWGIESSPRKLQDRTIRKWLDIEDNVLPGVLSNTDQIVIAYGMINELVGYSGYNVEESTKLLNDILDEVLAIASGPKYSKFRAVIHKFQEKVPTTLTYLKELYRQFEERSAAEGVDLQLLTALYEMKRYPWTSPLYSQAIAEACKMAGYNSVTYAKAENLLQDILKHAHRSSSSAENNNSRSRKHGDSMSRIPKRREGLIRAKMNLTPFPHSQVKERVNKSAVELALGMKVDFYDELGIRKTIVLTVCIS